VHAAGQHFKQNYLTLFSFPSLSKKQYHLADLMIFVKPDVSCSIECNRLPVCVPPRADLVWRVRELQRADCRHSPASGLPARSGNMLDRSPHASSSPTSSCKRIALASRSGSAHLPLQQRRPVGLWLAAVAGAWWPAVVACAVQHSLSVTGTDSRDGVAS
jgi:hypothetical protein